MPRVKVPVPVEKDEPDKSSPVVESTPDLQQATPVESAELTAVRPSNKTFLVVGIGLLLLILLASTFTLMKDRNQLQDKVNKLSNPANTSKDEAKQLSSQIGQYFLLPTNETPTLATVTDINKVKGQAFFKDAQNGDKVLLYSKAGEAILYRPGVKKVINVAQVNLNGASAPGTTGTNP